MLERFKNLFPKELKKRGLFRSVQAVQIVSEWPKILEQVKPQFIKRTNAISFKSGVLTIMCEHGAVAQEIESNKERIIQLYQKVFPSEPVRLRLRVGGLLDPEQQTLSQ